MLSKRIIASLILKDGVFVQSIGFSRYLPVGSPEIAVDFLNQWGADEISVVEIGENRKNKTPDLVLVAALSKKSFVPLAIGGGVDSTDTMRALIYGGADKLIINRAAVLNPQLISDGAAIFGNQCIVVSIDAKKNKNGAYEVFLDSGTTPTGKDPAALAAECERLGAGEILIRSIDRDGSKNGFDVELVRLVSDAVSVPVIAAGGCGHPKHILDAFMQGGADAVAVGNFFHFTEHSVTTVKAYLKSHVPVRHDTYATYENFSFDPLGRVAKQPDGYLEKLRFEYHPKEII